MHEEGGPAMLRLMSCQDSEAMASSRRRELDIPRPLAARLGREAAEFAEQGYYLRETGEKVDWARFVQAACAAKRSIPPAAELPCAEPVRFPETLVRVANETTLAAARPLVDAGQRVLALNFANGVAPGGGFRSGARAQEEMLCRSSGLFQTLAGDPMYLAHRECSDRAFSDWAILSPGVPVFRDAAGAATLAQPWLLDFISCAAPVASAAGQPRSAELLQQRIHRVLSIARACAYTTLVLGAWGCGAFGNDPARTARDFRLALETEFDGAFSQLIFAVTDWSPERRFLGPFRDAFAS